MRAPRGLVIFSYVVCPPDGSLRGAAAHLRRPVPGERSARPRGGDGGGAAVSLSFPTAELRKIVGIGYYEERLLFLLLLLRRPRVKVVYLTSMPVEEAVVDYYLGFLPDPAGARARLHMLAAGDPAPRSLTAKLLDRPELLDRVRELCEGPGGAFVQPFNVTPSEQELSERLGLPLYGPPAELASLGSKTGSRRVARLAGVPVLDGAEDLRSVEAVEEAALRLRGRPARAGRRGRHQAQRRLLRPGQRRGRPGRAERLAARLAGGVLRRGGVVAVVRGQDRRGRGGRGGAAGRPGHGLPERAAARPARRGPPGPLDPQPGPRRPQPPGLPGLPLPGRPGLPRPDPGRGRAGGPGPGRPRRHRLLRGRLLRGPLRRPGGGLPLRDQPPGRRDHPPVRHGLAGHRRPLRRRRRPPGRRRPDQVVPGHRQPQVGVADRVRAPGR